MIKIDFAIKPKEIIPEYVTDEYGYKYIFDEKDELHSYNDMPAIITKKGTKRWYKHGIKHRDNDLPAIIWHSGIKEYWVNGERIK